MLWTSSDGKKGIPDNTEGDVGERRRVGCRMCVKETVWKYLRIWEASMALEVFKIPSSYIWSQEYIEFTWQLTKIQIPK